MIHKMEEAEGEDWLGISENQVRGAALCLSQHHLLKRRN